MTLKNLAYSKAEMEGRSEPKIMEYGEGSKYPYGLSLTLIKHCLEKLGKGAADFEVGETFQATVWFKVESVSTRETAGGERDESVVLTAVSMDLGGN